MTTAMETRAKYTDAEVEAMGRQGHAFKNPDGTHSYPVKDAEDLGKAIKAVGRGGADHDAIRKYIIGRAKALGLSSQIPDNWNADGSLGGQSSASRPNLELLKRRRGSMVRKQERRGMLLEMRAKPDGSGGTTFEFEGYGAVFDAPFDMWDPWGDPYTEVVKQGAFTRSLGRPELDVPFLIGHNDAGIPLARTRNGTMQLSQDSRGLHVKADMDGRRSDVRNLASAVERGDMDEMSIGFVTMGQQWSEDWETRSMTDLELHRGDVSAVALAANPATAGSMMTALPTETLSRQAAEQRASHGPYSGTHSHAHPAFGSQGGDASHEHEHSHDDDADHDHMHPNVGQNDRSDGREREQLASRGEINDNSNAPDFNMPSEPAPYDAGQHSWKPSVSCPSKDCPVYCQGDGQAQNELDSKYCDQCGSPLYNSDGLIVLDDSGVVNEMGGSMADADLLSRRLRLLELA